ncbi:unnamed protein product [Candidula unifasciata]|uniref:Uncharacterized protein n=1 Tax=Candidula unifasciata TaxID=100452 RepID=A0A8S4A0B8_9EUPU|nr:unnamed protein product [Candidula unifasciata]
MMQQKAEICPLLLKVIHNVLDRCRHGGHKRLRSEQHKLTKADLQPIVLEQSERIYCTCGTSPAGNSQGGLQRLSQTRLTRTEDLSQRIHSLQHSVENILASDREYIESTISMYDKIESHITKLFPSALLAMEETTKENEDANSQVFNSTEGGIRNYDLPRRIDRLEHSIESLLASKRDLVQRIGSRFDRLENLHKRVLPDAFVTIEKNTKDHEDADRRIFDYTMEYSLPNDDLFQRFCRLKRSADRLVTYGDDFVLSIASRTRSLRKRIYPYAVRAVDQIRKKQKEREDASSKILNKTTKAQNSSAAFSV